MVAKLLLAGFVPFALLAGCDGQTSASTSVPRGSTEEFALMTNPCMVQATQLTGLSSDKITVTNAQQTTAGPLLNMDVEGSPYFCRTEVDGSVTVFNSN